SSLATTGALATPLSLETSFATGSAAGSSFLAGSAFLSDTGSSFFCPFLGRVDESIVERSILLMTLGPSSSGASTLKTSDLTSRSSRGVSTTGGGGGGV